MNTQDAIKHLKSIGWFVEPIFPNRYNIRKIGQSDYPWASVDYSARELVKFAKCLSSENNQNTAAKKLTKKFDKKKNRSAERNLLASKDEEKLDEFGPTAKIKEENPWNWD
jgi:hypothetical protein